EKTVGDYTVRLDYRGGSEHAGHESHAGHAMSAPAPGHLMVFVADRANGEPVPYLPVSATITAPGKPARRVSLAPMVGGQGFHYGANVALPDGAHTITLNIGPVAVQTMTSTKGRFAKPVTVVFARGGDRKPTEAPPRAAAPRSRIARVASARRRLRRGERRVVVRLGSDLLHVLDVLHLAVLADHEHRARGEPGDRSVLDLDAVGGAEGAVAEVGERLDGRDPRGATPASLGERQIAADRPDLDAPAQLRGFLVEASRLGVAGRGVERGHGAQDHDLALRLAQLDGLEPVVERREIGRVLAGLHFRSAER